MSKKNELAGLITGLVAVLAAACFFIIGFMTGGWQYAWLVFLTVPVTAIVADIITKNKDFSGSIIGLIAVLAAAAFFVLGFVYGKWHPGWLVFLVVPIAAIVIDAIRKKDVSGSIIGLITVSAAVIFFILGFMFEIWSVSWLVFLAIPLAAIIIEMSKKKNPYGIVGIVALLAVAAFMLMGIYLGIWYIAWTVFLLAPITALVITIIKTAKDLSSNTEERKEDKRPE
jgi:asparagine N-glycosylation enzyme membrane subunit Stt3